MEVNKDTMETMKMVSDRVFSLKKANFILAQKLEVMSETLKNSADLLKAADIKPKKTLIEIPESVVSEMTLSKMELDRMFYLKKANFILTRQLAAKSEALKNSAVLLKAADETVKKLQSTVAEEKDKIERLLVKTVNFSEHSQVVSNSMKTVSTASQASVNIHDYNANSLWPAEAADKISRLEDELYKKRKCVTKLKNKLTRYRLQGGRIRGKPHPKTDYTQRHSEQLDL
jgi:hypothetical protein